MIKQLPCSRFFLVSLTICFLFLSRIDSYGQTRINVNTLAGLRSAVQNSNQEIVLAPNTYNITDLIEDDRYFLISGDNNTIDLTNVTIYFPVEINTPQAHFYFSGTGNTLLNGRIENIYHNGLTEVTDFVSYNTDKINLANGGKPHLVIAGNNTTIIGTEMIVRGSFPYGYGSYFGISGGPFGLEKRGGIQVNSTNTIIDGVYLKMDAFGHGIYIGPGEGAVTDNTIIRNTIVEGNVRLTNNLLAETGGLMEENDYKDNDGKLIPSNDAESLSEDGIRSYANSGSVFVENSTVSGMRSGIRLWLGTETEVTNTIAKDNRIANVSMNRNGFVEGVSANFTYGPALLVDSFEQNQQVDMTLLASPNAAGDHNIAEIKRESEIIFRRNPDAPIDNDEDRVIFVSANNAEITNYTEYTIVLDTGTSGNVIISCGEVIDNGANDVTLNDCFSGINSCETKDAFSKIEAEDYCSQSGLDINNTGDYIENIHNGDWIKYDSIDFGSGINTITVSASSQKDGGTIEIRQGSSFGNLIGTVVIENTGGWGDYETFTANFDSVSGEQEDVYFVNKGNSGFLFNVDSIQFSQDNTLSNNTIENNDNTVSIYPNPVKSSVTIQNATDKEILIYDTKGKLLLIESIKTEKQEIDLSVLSKGLYYAQIKNLQSTSTIKFLKR